jgi:hypothetical protein
MTWIRGVLVTVAVLPLAGCFQAATVIKLKADGSGTIEQRLLLTEAAMEQLRGFAILSGGNAAGADPTSEAQARSLAESLGPGVTYVSSTPVKTETAQGRDSVYAFTDITKLHLSEQPRLPGGMTFSPAGSANVGEITFTLTREPDGNGLLRIQLPKFNLLPIPAGPNGAVMAPSAQQIDMVKGILAGARLTVSVEPEGRVVRTSSPFAEGNRVTLIDLDFDKAAADPDLATKLQSLKTADDVKAAVVSLQGVKITTDPEISITFAPQ